MTLTLSVTELPRPDGSKSALVSFGAVEGLKIPTSTVVVQTPEDSRVAEVGDGTRYPQGLWVRGSTRPLRPNDVLALAAAGMGGFAIVPQENSVPRTLDSTGATPYNGGKDAEDAFDF